MNLFAHQSSILVISRIVLAFSWVYQGLVPKIVCRSPGELNLIAPVTLVYQVACNLITVMGYGEILFGVALLVVAHRWVFLLNIAVLTLLLGYVAVFEPAMFTMPFNPLTLNVALAGLSLVAIIELKKQQKGS